MNLNGFLFGLLFYLSCFAPFHSKFRIRFTFTIHTSLVTVSLFWLRFFEMVTESDTNSLFTKNRALAFDSFQKFGHFISSKGFQFKFFQPPKVQFIYRLCQFIRNFSREFIILCHSSQSHWWISNEFACWINKIIDLSQLQMQWIFRAPPSTTVSLNLIQFIHQISQKSKFMWNSPKIENYELNGNEIDNA